MQCSKDFLNVTQVFLNSLKEGINLNRYYLFKPDEAKHLLSMLGMFCDVTMRYIEVSFYYDPKKNQTIALKVFKKPMGYNYNLIKYLDTDVENYLNTINISQTPDELRKLVIMNFL